MLPREPFFGMNCAMQRMLVDGLKQPQSVRTVACPGSPCVTKPLGTLMLYIAMRGSVRTLPVVSGSGTANRFLDNTTCGHAPDLMNCLFGIVHPPPYTKLNVSLLIDTGCKGVVPNETEYALAFLRFYFFSGSRQLPYAVAPPRTGRESHVVSVHIRGSDSCNRVSYAPTGTELFHGMWLHRNVSSWWERKRVCVHASVYADRVRSLQTRVPIRLVLLCSDDPVAIRIFEAMVDVPVKRLNWDMRDFRTTVNGTRGWYDFRKTSSEFMRSAVGDVRFLATGSFLVASMCSKYASMIYNVMVAHHGRNIPYESVDGCGPYLFPWDTLHVVPDQGPRVNMHLGELLVDRQSNVRGSPV